MASGVEHMMVLGRSLAYSHESPRGIREPPVYAAYRPSLATLLSATRPSYYHPLIFFRLHPRRFSNRQIVDWFTFTREPSSKTCTSQGGSQLDAP
jgi:hypothetical protein